MSSERVLLPVHEAASILGVSEKAVRNWITQGRLPVVRVGRAVRLRRADLNRIVEGGLAAVERRPGRVAEPAVTA